MSVMSASVMSVLGFFIGAGVGYALRRHQNAVMNKKAIKLQKDSQLFHTLESEGLDRPNTEEEPSKEDAGISQQPASSDLVKGEQNEST